MNQKHLLFAGIVIGALIAISYDWFEIFYAVELSGTATLDDLLKVSSKIFAGLTAFGIGFGLYALFMWLGKVYGKDSTKTPESKKEEITSNSGAQTSSSDDPKRDKLIFDLVKGSLEHEWRRISELDSKASNLIGFIAVVIGLLLGAGTFNFSTLSSNYELAVPYFIGIGLLLLSIGFALGAFKVRRFDYVPDVKHLIKEYTSRPYDEVLKTVGAEMAKVTKEIETKNNSKAKLIDRSWYLLIAGLTTVFISVILFFASS